MSPKGFKLRNKYYPQTHNNLFSVSFPLKQRYHDGGIHMTTYDYFKQYVDRLEHFKAVTAHEEHIMEFKAMCADMIIS